MGYHHHQTFVGCVHYSITSILMTLISLLHLVNSFACPPGTRALCCLSNPFLNPNSNKVYQHCQLWLEYFDKPECRDKAGHVCCEEPFDIALGVCETDQEPDSCPPYYTPPPNKEEGVDGDGDEPSPRNIIDPPGNTGGGDGGVNENWNGWWSPNPPGGPWPNRPPGLWKLKKLRRGCDAAAATPPPPPPPHSSSSSSLKQLKPSSSSSFFSSSSYSSDNYYYNDDDDDDDAQVEAALAGREDGEFYAKVPNHGG